MKITIPFMSADDLLHDALIYNLSPYQIEYLKYFIIRWDAGMTENYDAINPLEQEYTSWINLQNQIN